MEKPVFIREEHISLEVEVSSKRHLGPKFSETREAMKLLKPETLNLF